MEKASVIQYINQLYNDFKKLKAGDEMVVDIEKIGFEKGALPPYFYQRFENEDLEFGPKNLKDPVTYQYNAVYYIKKSNLNQGITTSDALY